MDTFKPVTDLSDTIVEMNSSDYKDRFRAEYHQLYIRYQKLKAMLERWDKGELGFVPTCPRSIYDVQLGSMANYLAILEVRAVAESIIL